MKIAYIIIIFLLTILTGFLTFGFLVNVPNEDAILPLTIIFCVLLLILTYLVVGNLDGKKKE